MHAYKYICHLLTRPILKTLISFSPHCFYCVPWVAVHYMKGSVRSSWLWVGSRETLASPTACPLPVPFVIVVCLSMWKVSPLPKECMLLRSFWLFLGQKEMLSSTSALTQSIPRSRSTWSKKEIAFLNAIIEEASINCLVVTESSSAKVLCTPTVSKHSFGVHSLSNFTNIH